VLGTETVNAKKGKDTTIKQTTLLDNGFSKAWQ
jgi:hypothetical protein